MHEYSLVQALLERVEEEARAHRASAVRCLCVRIGELSGVEPELFASAYEIARGQTVCEAADLLLERVPATWACTVCRAPIDPGAALACPRCGSPGRLAQGDEIVLARIEMEVH